MPHSSKGNPRKFEDHANDMEDNPNDYFPDFEIERRMKELMSRALHMDKDGQWRPGFKPVFDMKTGQNYEAPFLSADELKRRGY